MFKADYLRTFRVLAYRDLHFIISGLVTRLIDAGIIGFAQLLAIGSFLPLLGIPRAMIAPLFMGTMTQIIFSVSYGIVFNYVVDLNKNKFINYQILLPIPKTLLFAKFILIFMVEIFFVSFPLLFFGSLYLGPLFPIYNANWFYVGTMYLVILFFSALLFLYLAFSSSYIWFVDNIWARRVSPLFLLGCSFFTWKKLYYFNSTFAYILLLNPLTYIHEGMRSAFFGTNEFLPFWLCFFIIIGFSIFLVWLFSRAIKKRLDPV